MTNNSHLSPTPPSDGGNKPPAGNTPISGTKQPYTEARTFRDLEGTLWIVHEVSGEALGGGPTSLLLVSPRQVRRVSPYPAEWTNLSPRALLELPYTRL